MFTVTGKLSNKSVLKTGVSEHGTWRVLNFCIEKTRKRKPIKIPITAKGSLAAKINDIAIGEKIRVTFFIEGKKHNDRYITDCVAIDVEKHVRKSKHFGQESFHDLAKEEQRYEFTRDYSLFNPNNIP
jgi:hypothetical protein